MNGAVPGFVEQTKQMCQRRDSRKVCYELVLGATAGKKTHLAGLWFVSGISLVIRSINTIRVAVMANLRHLDAFMESVIGM